MIHRLDLILNNFDFLIEVYGFRVVDNQLDENMMGNAYVLYETSLLGIEVVIDRNQGLIRMGVLTTQSRNWFDMSIAIDYFSSGSERTYIFPEKNGQNSWDDIIRSQLQRLAKLLQKYCEPLLRGDFSMVENIQKIKEKREDSVINSLNEISKKARNNY